VGAFLGIYVRDMDRERWWPALVQRAEDDGMVWRDGEFGESGGKGEALNSLKGEELFAGRLAPQEQAPLSRDPVGSGKLADDPEHITALHEGVDAPMPALMAGAEGVSAPFGVGDVAASARPAVVARPAMKAIAIEEKGAVQEGVAVAQVTEKTPQQERIQNSEVRIQKPPHPALSPEYRGEGKSANAGAANSGGPAGDPAPMSESESDAFSRAGTIAVRNGKVEARLGRNFKSVKPRLSLKGELDAISVQRPVVEMKVYLDETGKVIDVKVLRSSGSNEIDLPTTSAMYKWWIEPAKDKEGKAMKDVILVTFSYL
jgi:TonB family protein